MLHMHFCCCVDVTRSLCSCVFPCSLLEASLASFIDIGLFYRCKSLCIDIDIGLFSQILVSFHRYRSFFVDLHLFHRYKSLFIDRCKQTHALLRPHPGSIFPHRPSHLRQSSTVHGGDLLGVKRTCRTWLIPSTKLISGFQLSRHIDGPRGFGRGHLCGAKRVASRPTYSCKLCPHLYLAPKDYQCVCVCGHACACLRARECACAHSYICLCLCLCARVCVSVCAH
mmetsp:Transcript_85528/g.138671  ORF Transcript_85528/g.138671 Transcript_85528/m.138671 type:complete len:226 (-) Transcript_85528:482-1159(-)